MLITTVVDEYNTMLNMSHAMCPSALYPVSVLGPAGPLVSSIGARRAPISALGERPEGVARCNVAWYPVSRERPDTVLGGTIFDHIIHY